MTTPWLVTTTSTEVSITLDDPTVLAQRPPHVPLRFRPLRGPHRETTLLGNQPGSSPAYTIDGTTLHILHADLVAAIHKAGAAWPGQIVLRDDTVIFTQLDTVSDRAA